MIGKSNGSHVTLALQNTDHIIKNIVMKLVCQQIDHRSTIKQKPAQTRSHRRCKDNDDGFIKARHDR